MTDLLGNTAPAFTLADLIREAEREVVLRQTVYKNRVEAGKMKEATATRQIALMRAIAERLRAEAEKEATAPSGSCC
jgi:hypothetical protein